MLSVAICDDEDMVCSQLEEMIQGYAADKRKEISVEIFYTGEELYAALEEKHDFDLIFLDIALEGASGIETGRKIRRELKNLSTEIVYISGESSHAMELFDNHPLNFLIKPLAEKKVAECLEICEELRHRGETAFICRIGRETRRIRQRDILYFESKNRKIDMVTNRETISFYGKLEEVYAKVEAGNFLWIHKSLLVNYDHVEELQYDRLVVTGGITLPISQSRRQQIREKVSQMEEKEYRHGN